MTFDSMTVIGQLQDLEQQIAATPQYVDSLQRAFARGDRADILYHLVHSEHHVRSMATTTACIRDHVVNMDGLGGMLESLAELVLRAVRMVLLAELDALRGLWRGPAASRRSTRLFGDRFRSIDDLASFVHAELDRITLMWNRDQPWVDRRAFRAALRAAAQAMRRLGEAPELSRFLRDGAGHSDWPALIRICRRIRAALDIRIMVEPDQPLLIHCDRLHELTSQGRL
jgi:hypothetical protein